MASTLREPLPQPRQEDPARDRALNNLAIVRTWWTVLEREWQAALAEPPADGSPGFAMIDPSLRAAVAPFDDFAASADDLLAFGEQVVISVSLRGRIAGREMASHEGWVCLLDEGTVLDVRQYTSVQDALAAVAAAAPETPIIAARL
jgi:ketosteroid isomerase-like protein